MPPWMRSTSGNSACSWRPSEGSGSDADHRSLCDLLAYWDLEVSMALQLGALRDALIEAGVSETKAREAAEEVAGYENRLTRLTTMVQAMIAIGMLLLASQGAIWLEIGKLTSQQAGVSAKIDQISTKIDRLVH